MQLKWLKTLDICSSFLIASIQSKINIFLQNIKMNLPSPTLAMALRYLSNEKNTPNSFDSAVEIGVGDGRDAFYLTELFNNVTAIDFSSDLLINIKEKNNSIQILEKDIRELSLVNFENNVDLINCLYVMQFYLKEILPPFLESIFHFLKNGGVFSFGIVLDIRKDKELSEQFVINCLESIGFEILYKIKGNALDTDHGSPHWHILFDLVAKKIV